MVKEKEKKSQYIVNLRLHQVICMYVPYRTVPFQPRDPNSAMVVVVSNSDF